MYSLMCCCGYELLPTQVMDIVGTLIWDIFTLLGFKYSVKAFVKIDYDGLKNHLWSMEFMCLLSSQQIKQKQTLFSMAEASKSSYVEDSMVGVWGSAAYLARAGNAAASSTTLATRRLSWTWAPLALWLDGAGDGETLRGAGRSVEGKKNILEHSFWEKVFCTLALFCWVKKYLEVMKNLRANLLVRCP